MNPSQKAQAVALFQTGKGTQEIAAFLGLNYDVVWNFLQFGARDASGTLLEPQRQNLDVPGSVV